MRRSRRRAVWSCAHRLSLSMAWTSMRAGSVCVCVSVSASPTRETHGVGSGVGRGCARVWRVRLCVVTPLSVRLSPCDSQNASGVRGQECIAEIETEGSVVKRSQTESVGGKCDIGVHQYASRLRLCLRVRLCICDQTQRETHGVGSGVGRRCATSLACPSLCRHSAVCATVCDSQTASGVR